MDKEGLGEDVENAEVKDEETIFITKEITECFAVFDQNNTGQIPTKFLNKALGALGIKLCDFELGEANEKLNRNGFIDFKDFLDYAANKLKAVDHIVLAKQAFSVFDKEKEGFIPTDRFKKWMMTLGDQLTESEAKELCRMGDVNNKGVFSYDDVAAVFFY